MLLTARYHILPFKGGSFWLSFVPHRYLGRNTKFAHGTDADVIMPYFFPPCRAHGVHRSPPTGGGIGDGVLGG